MAIENSNFTDVGLIAQELKAQIRCGTKWHDLTPAAKESLDQIATLIARIVSGDQPHWEAIVGYAQAAQSTPTIEIERDIRRLVREIPKGNSDAQ